MNHHCALVRFLVLMAIVAFSSSVPASGQTARRTTGDGAEVIPSDVPTSGDCDLDWIIFKAGQREGVDPRFIHAVIQQESHYRSEADSYLGKHGLMQLMPATAARSNRDNRAAADVEAGTKYLAWLLKRFDGDVKLALAAYNAGEGAVNDYKGVPPYATNDIKRMELDGLGEVRITQSVTVKSEGNYNKVTVTDSISVEKPGRLAQLPASEMSVRLSEDPKREVSGMGLVEVLAVSRLDGREVQHKRIYYAPKLNPAKVRMYRQPSSPAAEMLPVGAEFTFWVGNGEDQTPLSDKVTITVHPHNNVPVKLQVKDLTASAK